MADGGIEFPYDHIVISLGGQPNFFGIPGVEEHSLTMRGVEDAERIRNRVIERFEEVSLIRGEVPESKLTFVVIGGWGDRGRGGLGDPHPRPREPGPGLPEHRPAPRPDLPARRASEHPAGAGSRAAQGRPRRLVNERIEVRTNAMAEEITDELREAQGRQHR